MNELLVHANKNEFVCVCVCPHRALSDNLVFFFFFFFLRRHTGTEQRLIKIAEVP